MILPSFTIATSLSPETVVMTCLPPSSLTIFMIAGQRVGRDDVIGEDLDELGLVLGLEQRFDRARGQHLERLVGRRKTVNGPAPFQRLDQSAAFTAATSVV